MWCGSHVRQNDKKLNNRDIGVLVSVSFSVNPKKNYRHYHCDTVYGDSYTDLVLIRSLIKR